MQANPNFIIGFLPKITHHETLHLCRFDHYDGMRSQTGQRKPLCLSTLLQSTIMRGEHGLCHLPPVNQRWHAGSTLGKDSVCKEWQPCAPPKLLKDLNQGAHTAPSTHAGSQGEEGPFPSLTLNEDVVQFLQKLRAEIAPQVLLLQSWGCSCTGSTLHSGHPGCLFNLPECEPKYLLGVHNLHWYKKVVKVGNCFRTAYRSIQVGGIRYSYILEDLN